MMNNCFRISLLTWAFLISAFSLNAQDYYIIGQNVNGHEWELSSPDCGFTEIGAGLYEWTGQVLASSFNINDGTWTNGDNTFGSNGNKLKPGQSYRYKAGDNVGAIILDEVREILNPKVTLDIVRGTILVESREIETPDNPFENENYALLNVKMENGIGMESKLPHYAEITLDFDLDEYWTIISASENGVLLNPESLDKTLDIKMDCDKTIVVTTSYARQLEWVDLISGFASSEILPLEFSYENGTLEISGLERGDEIVVYSLSGQVISRYTAQSGKLTCNPTPGTYIVRVNEKAVKVQF